MSVGRGFSRTLVASTSQDRLVGSRMVALALRARTPAEAQRHRRAIQRARDEGPRQTEFGSRGSFFSGRNDLWFHGSRLLVARVGSGLASKGSGGCGSTDRD